MDPWQGTPPPGQGTAGTSAIPTTLQQQQQQQHQQQQHLQQMQYQQRQPQAGAFFPHMGMSHPGLMALQPQQQPQQLQPQHAPHWVHAFQHPAGVIPSVFNTPQPRGVSPMGHGSHDPGAYTPDPAALQQARAVHWPTVPSWLQWGHGAGQQQPPVQPPRPPPPAVSGGGGASGEARAPAHHGPRKEGRRWRRRDREGEGASREKALRRKRTSRQQQRQRRQEEEGGEEQGTPRTSKTAASTKPEDEGGEHGGEEMGEEEVDGDEEEEDAEKKGPREGARGKNAVQRKGKRGVTQGARGAAVGQSVPEQKEAGAASPGMRAWPGSLSSWLSAYMHPSKQGGQAVQQEQPAAQQQGASAPGARGGMTPASLQALFHPQAPSGMLQQALQQQQQQQRQQQRQQQQHQPLTQLMAHHQQQQQQQQQQQLPQAQQLPETSKGVPGMRSAFLPFGGRGVSDGSRYLDPSSLYMLHQLWQQVPGFPPHEQQPKPQGSVIPSVLGGDTQGSSDRGSGTIGMLTGPQQQQQQQQLHQQQQLQQQLPPPPPQAALGPAAPVAFPTSQGMPFLGGMPTWPIQVSAPGAPAGMLPRPEHGTAPQVPGHGPADVAPAGVPADPTILSRRLLSSSPDQAESMPHHLPPPPVGSAQCICPICHRRGRQSPTRICSVCYSGLYNDVRKWKRMVGDNVDPGMTLSDFIDQLKAMPRGCTNNYRCNFERSRASPQCTRCRTIKVCMYAPELLQRILRRMVMRRGPSSALQSSGQHPGSEDNDDVAADMEREEESESTGSAPKQAKRGGQNYASASSDGGNADVGARGASSTTPTKSMEGAWKTSAHDKEEGDDDAKRRDDMTREPQQRSSTELKGAGY